MRQEPYFDTNLTDFDGEVWKDVKGFDGFYSVSNFGRVRSEARYVRTGRGGERLKKQFIMKQQVKVKQSVYDALMQVNFSVSGVVYCQKVHQLVGRAFCRPLKKGEMYYRIDFNTKNNRAENIGIAMSNSFISVSKNRKGQTKNHSPKVSESAKALSMKTGISVKKIMQHNITQQP